MATDCQSDNCRIAKPSGDDVPVLMDVSVCHAGPEQIWLLTLAIPRGATVSDALSASNIAAQIPQIDLASAPVGIYGKRVARTRKLNPGDRVEIYRPLAYDPKESRRRRAQHRSRLRDKESGADKGADASGS